MKLFFPFPKPNVLATFVRRPQRFLAEVELQTGGTVIAYCANPGSFGPGFLRGSKVLLWESPKPGRKRQHTWRAVKIGKTWVGTDTHLANRLVDKALFEKALPPFQEAALVAREPQGTHGRLDFQLKQAQQECYVEVKSATVVDGESARFPDSKSPRAVSHLRALSSQVKAGHRAVMLFLVQRGDVASVKINRDCDPAFTRAFERARRNGVEFLGVRHRVSPRGFGPPEVIPVLA